VELLDDDGARGAGHHDADAPLVLPARAARPGEGSGAAERFKTPLRVLDGALEGRRDLVGDAFSVADLNVASVLSSAPLARLDLSSAPNVLAWLVRCTERPAYARVLEKLRGPPAQL
jgi:glutathione S-transferase